MQMPPIYLQRLNQQVVRSWAINKRLPYGPGQYDESQFQGLDYFVASAARHGVRLMLNLGDYWSFFVGPGAWMSWAGVTATGNAVVQFYGSNATRVLYKQHIDTMVNRKNAITGVVYKKDPTIMGWVVINEPRCPGCDASQQAIRRSWLTEMADHVRSAAPTQLVVSGTEGYFQGDLAKYNHGYGSTCEGEDWVSDNSIPSIDVATTHFYFNMVWGPAQLGARKLNWSEYLNFIVQKMNIHTEIAGQIGKAFMIEEFGEPYIDKNNNHTPEDRMMLYAVVYEKLIAAKMAGKPFIGALFWNATVDGQRSSNDDINIFVDRTPSNPITLGSDVKAPGGTAHGGGNSSMTGARGQSPTASDGASSQLGKRRMLLAQRLRSGAVRQLTQERTARQLAQEQAARKLSAAYQGEDIGQEARAACAAAAINTWMSLPTDLVDVDYYRALVAGHDVLDIIAAAGLAISS
eukprot:GHRR01003834.1.p1 GENE.GHRR01003834.1~~GHRR01003834.1.p1  ORF type:complete len:462 (+),score=102.74 GHRR01003834.1:228-1613(+)